LGLWHSFENSVLFSSNVGAGTDEFTIEVHHGGFFVGHDHMRTYMDERVNWFDNVEAETWSPLWFEDFAEQLGYEKDQA